MNVFLYSDDKLLLLAIAEAVSKEGDTPFLASDFQTLMSLVQMTDPDIAFVDESVFPQEKILKLQKHIFDVLLDFPITSMSNPYFTEYRGQVSESKFCALADAVMSAVQKHHGVDVLSPKLSSLLAFFLAHKGENLRTDVLMNHLWQNCCKEHTKTLRTYICKLREKLSASAHGCTIEKTSKGTYCLMEHPVSTQEFPTT